MTRETYRVIDAILRANVNRNNHAWRRFWEHRLVLTLRRAQALRACGTTRHVSPEVRAIMSRFWYRMAEATTTESR